MSSLNAVYLRLKNKTVATVPTSNPPPRKKRRKNRNT